jgi:hypothetical protein
MPGLSERSGEFAVEGGEDVRLLGAKAAIVRAADEDVGVVVVVAESGRPYGA